MKLEQDRETWVVRAMTHEDLDEVHAIETRTHIEPWSKGIMGDCIDVGYTCLVLVENRKICAYSITRIAAGEAHILNICVPAERQAQGMGRYLLNFIIDVAKQRYCERVVLEVRVSNTGAIRLYEQRGFKVTGERKDYYAIPKTGGREDAIMYALELEY